MQRFARRETVLRAVSVAGAVLACLAISSPVARADMVTVLDACRTVRRVTAPQSDDLLTSQCGRRFSSRDPYIAIVTRIRDTEPLPRVDATVVISDPDQAVVESYQWGQDVGPTRTREVWDVAILPLAASPADLAAQLPNLQEDIVQVKSGRAFRERLGTWTIRVTVNRQPHSLTFTLESN